MSEANGRSPEQINYTPVPRMCSGYVISQLDNKTATYEIQIYNSPIGDFNGPIYCTSIYSAGCDNDYRVGDSVKVLVTFLFGGADNKIIDMAPGTEAYIMGNFDDTALFPRTTTNPLLPSCNDTVRFFNKRSKAGMAVGDNGHVTIAANGPVYSYYRPGGFGTGKNSFTTYAQNFHRVLSNNAPFDTAREHFGLFSGESEIDESTRLSPKSNYVIKRSYTPADKGLTRWVSSCEGAFAPFVGPNNKSDRVKPSRKTLFHKIVNSDKSRLTIDAGNPGDSFFEMRVDNVIMGEKYLDIGSGATTGILGNLFKMKVSDKGDFELSGGSKGIPVANINGFKITGDKNGGLSIQASKKLTLTTGDGEDKINSIEISTDGAIDVKTSAGFTVNGQPVATSDFIEWFIKNMPKMFLSSAPGTPAVPEPTCIVDMVAKFNLPTITGKGFTTKGVNIPMPGIIMDSDPYKTV